MATLLDDGDIGVALTAATTLSRLVACAIPTLLLCLWSEAPWIRSAAAAALGEVGAGSTKVKAALENARDDPTGDVRRSVRNALERLGA